MTLDAIFRKKTAVVSALIVALLGCRPVLVEPSGAPVPGPSGGFGCAVGHGVDDDADGIADECEAALGERFAPVMIHSSKESSFPTDVDDLLSRTSLAFRDDACRAGHPVLVAAAPSQDGLLRRTFSSPCDDQVSCSDGSRSDRKHKTFFLADVARPARAGNPDTQHWKTYVHSYPNDHGGMTLQYWRLYAYDDGFAGHGGDWESVQVVLGSGGEVARVRLLGHTSIDDLPPSALTWDRTHPIVYSEGGGHASRARGESIPATGCVESAACTVSKDDVRTFVRQETWSGGRVSWPDGRVTGGGGLVNVGEKSHPLHGLVFIRYSGLWGSPGRFYFSSGYWGPAFNETSMRRDGFVTAWCEGMAGTLEASRECWPAKNER